ncbi:hypothetical protein C8R44DRAFT_854889 [Mycena epipterygia]|nr:hypothetical protein C8R44DRAFT_854889 [Mycena epipterygia]
MPAASSVATLAWNEQNDGVVRPSFVMDHLRSLDEYGGNDTQEDAIKGVANAMYGGGSNTNPEAQKKVQQEIDSIVRQGHLLDFADEEDLPFVCLRERNPEMVAHHSPQ